VGQHEWGRAWHLTFVDGFSTGNNVHDTAKSRLADWNPAMMGDPLAVSMTSVPSIAMVQTEFSPRCEATSRTRRPPLKFWARAPRALRIGGRLSVLNWHWHGCEGMQSVRRYLVTFSLISTLINQSKIHTRYWLILLINTDFVPSEMACLASSPGRISRTEVRISREDIVDFLEYEAGSR
jgi:hypothetical protein